MADPDNRRTGGAPPSRTAGRSYADELDDAVPSGSRETALGGSRYRSYVSERR